VLLIPKEPEESTAFFRFQVMKTPDPRDVYERALTYLQADYFQTPETFSDRLATVLPADSSLAAPLIAADECILEFDQSGQGYRIAAEVRIASLEQWGDIQTQLAGISNVTGVTVTAMHIGYARIVLTHIGNAEQLREALSGAGLILTNRNGQWTLARAGQ